MNRLRLTFASFVLFSACADEPPPPSGNFDRPSGLAVVSRSADREDLFVADSLAEGVRVVQLLRTSATEYDAAIVPAPAALFPLAIEASGFPERLAVSSDGERLFALASGNARLYVIDARPVAFGAGATSSDSLRTLGFVELPGLVGEGLVVSDLAMVPSPDGKDRVVVVGTRVSGAGVLVGLEFEKGTATVVRAPELVEVPAGARALRAHGNELVTSSAATSNVAVIPLGDASAAKMLGTPRTVDVGGPTEGLIDAGALGVLAIRTDRSSLVLLEGEALARSTRRFINHATALVDRQDPAAVGRIDVRGPRPVSGAFGRVATFPNPLDAEDDFATGRADADGLLDVVFLMHLDATESFLFGKDFEVLPESRIEHLTKRGPESFDVEECEPTAVAACGEDELEPACEGILVTDPRTTARNLAVEFRGRLAEAFSVPYERTDDVVSIVGLSSSIKVGDAISVGLELRPDCAKQQTLEYVRTGTVTDQTGIQIQAVFPTLPPEDAGCSTDEKTFNWVQVRPTGREVVVTEVDDYDRVLRVVGRVATSTTESGEIARIERPLALTLRATEFSCTEATRELECGEDAACPGTSTCNTQCPFVCGACSGNDPSCTPMPSLLCSGLDVRLSASFANDPTSSDNFQRAVPDQVVFSELNASWFTSFPGSRSISETGVDAEGLRTSYIR